MRTRQEAFNLSNAVRDFAVAAGARLALFRTIPISLAMITLAAGMAAAQTISPPVISQAGWKLRTVDSQEATGGYLATNAFDGNAATFWHTEWVSARPAAPHQIQINLTRAYQIAGFKYLPRADAQNGRIAKYEFYVSTDGSTWGTAVATGTFTNSTKEQQILFTAKTGQYVRLRALSEVGGLPYAAVAELNVLGTAVAGANQAPDGVIATPGGDVTIAPGQNVSVAGSGTDPENSALTYAWAFAGGSPATSTSQNPGAVTFATAGVYTMTLTVKDAQNAVDPTPATRTVTVQSAPVVISQARWTTRYVDSEDTASGNVATKAFDGNAATFWHTQWVGAQPEAPHELQINLGGVYQVSGFKYLARQDGPNGRIAQYEFYVSTDGSTWGAAVAAGTFADVSTEQHVPFTAKTGQYVRLRALSEVNGLPYTSVAELNVLSMSAGIPVNESPYITLTDVGPGGPYVAPAAVALRATASDRDGTVTRVDFYSNSVLLQTDTVSTYDFALPNVAPGTYQFVAVARDDSGNTTVSNTITITLRDPAAAANVLFTPSAEHDTLVQRYVVDIFAASADPTSATPLATLDIGKPAVVSGGCIADVRALFASLPEGTYVATVTAVAGADSIQSDQSAAFVL